MLFSAQYEGGVCNNLVMGFTGLFVDRVLKYAGNVVIGKEEIKEKEVRK